MKLTNVVHLKRKKAFDYFKKKMLTRVHVYGVNFHVLVLFVLLYLFIICRQIITKVYCQSCAQSSNCFIVGPTPGISHFQVWYEQCLNWSPSILHQNQFCIRFRNAWLYAAMFWCKMKSLLISLYLKYYHKFMKCISCVFCSWSKILSWFCFSVLFGLPGNILRHIILVLWRSYSGENLMHLLIVKSFNFFRYWSPWRAG